MSALPHSASKAPSSPIESVELGVRFDNSYARELDGAFVRQRPATVPAPRMVRFNAALADELGITPDDLDGETGARVFSGNALPAGAEPLAQAYAGHQFGGFSPQLGDGRALLLGEVVDRSGRRRDLALKGSGRTPFSRGGDGKAALGPVLREYLVGEAMHALGVPTTRALAAVTTGEAIYRETVLPGAVLTRVASSHIRVGTFQYFAAHGQHDRLRRLLDYTIARHDPDLEGRPDRALRLLEAVARRQAALVAQWLQFGFIHGVMNTDNMTISGETIDYGPCAFLEAYDPATVFSSIDTGGRYAFGNQPHLARWNLARLAEALLPLIDDDSERAITQATEIIDAFPGWFDERWQTVLRAKLGLASEQPGDDELAADWLKLLEEGRIDYTLGWRALGPASADASALDALFGTADDGSKQRATAWAARWRSRLAAESDGADACRARIQAANPAVIARNHRVEEALEAAVDQGDLEPFDRLLEALRAPFADRDAGDAHAQPAPADVTARYRTFCGT